MNESAVVSGVKSLSDEDRAKYLTALNEHKKAIDRHQRGIRMHLEGDDGRSDDEGFEGYDENVGQIVLEGVTQSG
jgi:uncharacterized protein